MLAWNLDGITIHNTAVCDVSTGLIRGVATTQKYGSLYEWTALLTPNGFEIEVSAPVSGRRAIRTSRTLNLALEVASAVRDF
jgi:hypothetical protein